MLALTVGCNQINNVGYHIKVVKERVENDHAIYRGSTFLSEGRDYYAIYYTTSNWYKEYLLCKWPDSAKIFTYANRFDTYGKLRNRLDSIQNSIDEEKYSWR